MTTEYSLKIWTKNCGNAELHRVYLNADDGASIGYVQRKMVEQERGSSSYYDRHRAAKGDIYEVIADEISSTLSPGHLTSLWVAVGAKAEGDDLSKWFSLVGQVNGYGTDSPKVRRARKNFRVNL